MKGYGIYYHKINELNLLKQKNPDLALKKITAEFEALLWYEIIKGLNRSMIKSGFFPETLEKKIFEEFYFQEIAREISGKPGSLGDYLYKYLNKTFKDHKQTTDIK